MSRPITSTRAVQTASTHTCLRFTRLPSASRTEPSPSRLNVSQENVCSER